MPKTIQNKTEAESIAAAGIEGKHQELIDDPLKAAMDLAYALRELHDFAEVDRHYRYEERSKTAFKDASALLRRFGY
jgi:hypothetical protein